MFKNPLLNQHIKLVHSQTQSRYNNEKIVNDLSFREVSHLVLALRQEIIDAVRNAIPQNPLRNIWFLLGATGSGKTTAMMFLRGDKMKINRNWAYESEKDTQHLIGHESATSCTVLPNVQIIGDVILVDYLGWNDTGGSILCLASDLALRALIAEYSPQILFMDSITNEHGAYANIAESSAKLKHIIENRESCILGLTKYSRVCATASQIEMREEKFLEIFGMNTLLKFDDLESPAVHKKCLESLTRNPKKPARINPSLHLENSERSFLEYCFKNNLLPELISGNPCRSAQYKNPEELNLVIKEKGLCFLWTKW